MTLPAEFPRRRFTAREVLQMAEAGIFRESEHVELIEGELIVTPPQGPTHAGFVTELGDVLRGAYPASAGFQIRPALPLSVDEQTEPEPDYAVVRGDARDFRKRHPSGDQAVLVIEVANTSLRLDRAKAERYARGGVPMYIIVDVNARRVELHTSPNQQTGEYNYRASVDATETIQLPESQTKVRFADYF